MGLQSYSKVRNSVNWYQKLDKSTHNFMHPMRMLAQSYIQIKTLLKAKTSTSSLIKTLLNDPRNFTNVDFSIAPQRRGDAA